MPDPSTVLPTGATPTLGSNNPSGFSVAGAYTGPQSYAGMGTQTADGTAISVPTSMAAPDVKTVSTAIPPVPQSQTDNLQGLVSQATIGLNQANQQVQTAEQTQQQSQQQANSLQSLLLGETADTLALNTQYGLPQMSKDIRDLQLQQQGQQQKYLQGLTQIESGNIRSLSNNQITALNRQNAIDTAITGAQISAKQGNLLYAQEIVKNAIDAKYQPIRDALTMQNMILQQNKDSLDRADKKAADAKILANNLQLKQIEQNISDQKDIQNLALTISKNQAPQNVVNALTKAKSFNEAIAIASPYMQSLADKADISYKMAQTAKIYNDIKNESGLGTTPAQTLAYAQQYASTGQIPTGLPKGSFGVVAQYAKELPKQTGEIVSTATGVHPAQDTTYADALSSLSSVVQLAQQLKELDKNRIGGVVGGTLGAITGSEAQGKYLSTRTQIIDLLSRARSGAALTEQEVKTYEDMIPGRFSEPLGLGQNSDKRIQNFVDAVTKDMTQKANAKGWSIYGVSKVKLGDQEYTVGDIIKSPDGKVGRINSDGSITLIQ